MPIYEYKCAKCGAEFELLVRRDTVPACPECKSKDVAKRMSSPATSHSGDSGCDDCAGPGSGGHSCGCGGGCCCRRH